MAENKPKCKDNEVLEGNKCVPKTGTKTKPKTPIHDSTYKGKSIFNKGTEKGLKELEESGDL